MDEAVLQFFYVTVILSLLPVVITTFAGLLAAILQAATQVQEQSLSFVCKLFSALAFFGLFGDWMFGLLEELACDLIGRVI
ncbi:MAG: flagellar biosynthetic protein FliQ [bacterium]|nr:flagellar biosynthetic protein FliQ [bacterium]